MVARSQRAEPRQFIPRADVVPKMVARAATAVVRRVEVYMMDGIGMEGSVLNVGDVM